MNLIVEEEQVQRSKYIIVMRMDGILQLEDLIKELKILKESCDIIVTERSKRAESRNEVNPRSDVMMAILSDVESHHHQRRFMIAMIDKTQRAEKYRETKREDQLMVMTDSDIEDQNYVEAVATINREVPTSGWGTDDLH